MDKEKPPFDGPYTKSGNTVKDKSGAKHSPISRARHLAKMAMQQQQKKKTNEEVKLLKKTPSDDELHKTLGPTKNRSQGVKALMKTHDMSRTKAKKHINRLMNILAKEEVQEGAYSERDIENAERAKNPGMSSKKPAPQPEKKKEIKEFDAVKNFLNSFKRSSTMFKDDESSSSQPKSTATKPSSTASGSKMSFSGFNRASTINKG